MLVISVKSPKFLPGCPGGVLDGGPDLPHLWGIPFWESGQVWGVGIHFGVRHKGESCLERSLRTYLLGNLEYAWKIQFILYWTLNRATTPTETEFKNSQKWSLQFQMAPLENLPNVERGVGPISTQCLSENRRGGGTPMPFYKASMIVKPEIAQRSTPKLPGFLGLWELIGRGLVSIWVKRPIGQQSAWIWTQASLIKILLNKIQQCEETYKIKKHTQEGKKSKNKSNK